jgi:hypothetical protein
VDIVGGVNTELPTLSSNWGSEHCVWRGLRRHHSAFSPKRGVGFQGSFLLRQQLDAIAHSKSATLLESRREQFRYLRNSTI